MKAILMGNGINMLEKNNFDSKSIAHRFEQAINKNAKLLSKMFMSDENNINFYEESECGIKDNIERLSGKVFCYIKQKKANFTLNDRYRLIEILANISIESIFLQDSKVYIPKIPFKFISALESYNKIFSLNYYDNININKEITYLHGKLHIGKYESSPKIMVCSSFLYKYNEEYKEIIDKEYIEYDKIFIDARSIVLMPEIINYTKQNHFGEGLYPDEKLYSANDLFPSSGMGDLYAKLDDIEKLDIFGMSPYGDEDLINKITKIQDVTVYVYDLKNNSEKDEWIRKVKNVKLKDSEEFL